MASASDGNEVVSLFRELETYNYLGALGRIRVLQRNPGMPLLHRSILFSFLNIIQSERAYFLCQHTHESWSQMRSLLANTEQLVQDSPNIHILQLLSQYCEILRMRYQLLPVYMHLREMVEVVSNAAHSTTQQSGSVREVEATLEEDEETLLKIHYQISHWMPSSDCAQLKRNASNELNLVRSLLRTRRYLRYYDFMEVCMGLHQAQQELDAWKCSLSLRERPTTLSSLPLFNWLQNFFSVLKAKTSIYFQQALTCQLKIAGESNPMQAACSVSNKLFEIIESLTKKGNADFIALILQENPDELLSLNTTSSSVVFKRQSVSGTTNLGAMQVEATLQHRVLSGNGWCPSHILLERNGLKAWPAVFSWPPANLPNIRMHWPNIVCLLMENLQALQNLSTLSILDTYAHMNYLFQHIETRLTLVVAVEEGKVNPRTIKPLIVELCTWLRSACVQLPVNK